MEPRWIWRENWVTAGVFLSCRWARAGMGGEIPVGIDAQEIAAACVLMRVPRAEWPSVFAGVRLMSDAAKPKLLDRIKK